MAAHRVLAAGGKERGGGDAVPSATTSNAAYGRNDPVPSGFGRRGAVCFVAAPPRCPASPRRDALHTAPRRPERDPGYFSDRLLGAWRRIGNARDDQLEAGVLVRPRNAGHVAAVQPGDVTRQRQAETVAGM